MRSIKKLLVGLTIGLSIFAFNAISDSSPIKIMTIGILVPVQLPAIDEVVDGFEGELNHLYNTQNTRVIYLVQNAEGNTDTMHTILTQFKNQNVDIVVPIGTIANQMARSIIKTQPIVALAAQFTEADRASSSNKNITNIVDELTIEQQLTFIHKAIPSLKRLTLVYSPEERTNAQIQKANAVAQNYGITLQTLKVKQASELSNVDTRINTNSQGILILKDELIVSGIPELVKVANSRHLPLIASDTGSVENGAAFSVGVGERQIGSDGAMLALQVLQGTPASEVPIDIMTHYRVFINKDAAEKQHLDLGGVTSTANAYDYLVIYPDAL
jgi:putative ABC transport system substrate-binding protein